MNKKGRPRDPFFLVQRELALGKAMQYTIPDTESRDPDRLLYQSLEEVIRGMGMSLIELSVCRRKGRSGSPGSVQVRAFIYADGIISIDDCSRVHRAILPRLELVSPGQDIYLEVSSPGIDRLIKDGREFIYYTGKGIKCFRTDTSDWTQGILLAADEKKIVLRSGDEEISLPYEIIAKARLDIASPSTGVVKNKTGG